MMKNAVLYALLVSLSLFQGVAFAQYYEDDVKVDGYTRNDGTSVRSHYRTGPNNIQQDNYSYGQGKNSYNPSSSTRSQSGLNLNHLENVDHNKRNAYPW